MAGLHPIRKPLQETVIPQKSTACDKGPVHRQKDYFKISNNLKNLQITNCNVKWTMDEKDKSADINGNTKDEPSRNSRDVADNGDSDINISSKVPQANFVISFEEDKHDKKWRKKKANASNLQDAFIKFRQSRQNDIKQSQLMKEKELATKCDSNQMWQLRMNFVETAKSYFGVPYAKKYHQAGTPEYNAPLFLDCCALVRQALRDLKEDFNFNIGPWNQAYQYDTLPITIEDEKDMKPGDLVFISGIYHNKKSKQQKHNMVHVEIWAGEGAKTIGARWQKGKVQVFDSYRFEAKSYHSMQYYFKSIDTWLQGICKSYCPEHQWSTTRYEPGRKSIFALQHQQQEELDEGAGDTEDDLLESDDDMMEEKLDQNQIRDCKVMGDDTRQDMTKEDTSIKESDTRGLAGSQAQQREEGDLRTRSQVGQEEVVEMKCWEHIERSPVRDTEVSEFEEGCWEGIESEHASGTLDVELDTYAENLGHETIVVDRSKGHHKMGEGLTLVSENTELKEVVEGIFHFCDVENQNNDRDHCQVNVGNHCKWGNKGDQPNITSRYCDCPSYCEGDNTTLNWVDELSSRHEVNTLDRLEERTQTCDDLSSETSYGGDGERTRVDAAQSGLQSTGGDDYKHDADKVINQQNSSVNRDVGLEEVICNCVCCNLETSTEDCDMTSLDDWPCLEVTRAANTWNDDNANLLIMQEVDKTKQALPCEKTQCTDDSSDMYGCHATHGNHGNDLDNGTTQNVGNLSSSDHIRDSPSLVNLLTFGDHGNELSRAEPKDGDDDQPQKSASNGSSSGQTGRKSPGKKVQKPQPSKGKSSDDSDLPPGPRGGGSVSRPSHKDVIGPAFYIGGGNGVSLVEEPLLAKGWHRIQDRQSTGFKLKWVELKTHINYNNFRPGDQLVNRIPNSHLLATKTGLCTTLRDYERLTGRTTSKTKPSRVLKMQDFFAESYVLEVKAEREAFFQTFKEGEIWICKPNGMNQGKGIYLVRDTTELRQKYEEKEKDPKKAALRPSVHGSRLIQRYIPNPYLLDGKKFDVRTYMLVACTNPFMVLFHSGYLRLACDDYDADSTDLHRHLTNQYQQKKHPDYQDIKEETVWSMERFNDHVNEIAEEKGLPKDWVMGYFHKQMNKIMLHCFNAVKNKLDTKLGLFDLLGFDFLIDTDMKVWLIEININPALHTNCEVLRNMMPGLVEETLDIVLEVFEKSKRNRPIMPLTSQRKYKMLYNGSSSSGSSSSERVRPAKSTSPTRSSPTRPRPGARSSSPPKRVSAGIRPVSVRQNVTKVVVKTSSKEAAAGASQANSKDAS